MQDSKMQHVVIQGYLKMTQLQLLSSLTSASAVSTENMTNLHSNFQNAAQKVHIY